jgi:hypothetical protein
LIEETSTEEEDAIGMKEVDECRLMSLLRTVADVEPDLER